MIIGVARRVAATVAGFGLVALAGGLAPLSPALAQEEEKVVNVYNWSDYIDEEILKDFEAETGIRVVYDVFDSNEILETKLLAGGTGYDVVVPTGTFLQRQILAGVFQKLDKSKLPNLSHMWPKIMEQVALYDPENEHAINYMWGTTGIGVNEAKVKAILGEDAPVDSLAIIFDPANAEKLAECGITILNTPEEVVPAALTYAGYPNNDAKDAEALAKAEEVLTAIRPYIRRFDSSPYINSLANGDICVALGWSGDVLQARDRAAEVDAGVTVAYHIPKEGALMWFDNMAIPSDAPHPQNAHLFLDYIMRPEVIAKASNYVYYANGNIDSQKLLNEDVIGDTAIYPKEETVEKLYTVTPSTAAETRVMNRLWTRIVTSQ